MSSHNFVFVLLCNLQVAVVILRPAKTAQPFNKAHTLLLLHLSNPGYDTIDPNKEVFDVKYWSLALSGKLAKINNFQRLNDARIPGGGTCCTSTASISEKSTAFKPAQSTPRNSLWSKSHGSAKLHRCSQQQSPALLHTRPGKRCSLDERCSLEVSFKDTRSMSQ